jgi:K319-like protein
MPAAGAVLARPNGAANGAGSDPDSDPITYHWVQRRGPPAALVNAGTAKPSLTAPSLAGSADLTFQVTVSDGLLSASAS